MNGIKFYFLAMFSLNSFAGSLQDYKSNWQANGCPSTVTKAAKGETEVDTLCKMYIKKNPPPVEMVGCPCEKAKRDMDIKAGKPGKYKCREEVIARSYYIGKAGLAKKWCASLFANTEASGPTCFLDAETTCIGNIVSASMVSAGVCPTEYSNTEADVSYAAMRGLRDDVNDGAFNSSIQKVIEKRKSICNGTVDSARAEEYQQPQQGRRNEDAKR